MIFVFRPLFRYRHTQFHLRGPRLIGINQCLLSTVGSSYTCAYAHAYAGAGALERGALDYARPRVRGGAAACAADGGGPRLRTKYKWNGSLVQMGQFVS